MHVKADLVALHLRRSGLQVWVKTDNVKDSDTIQSYPEHWREHNNVSYNTDPSDNNVTCSLAVTADYNTTPLDQHIFSPAHAHITFSTPLPTWK